MSAALRKMFVAWSVIWTVPFGGDRLTSFSPYGLEFVTESVNRVDVPPGLQRYRRVGPAEMAPADHPITIRVCIAAMTVMSPILRYMNFDGIRRRLWN